MNNTHHFKNSLVSNEMSSSNMHCPRCAELEAKLEQKENYIQHLRSY